MLLTAQWVIPVSGPPIRGGYVEVAGTRLRRLGRMADLCPHELRAAEALGPVALTPGLVNAHAHLELCAYAGRLSPAPFWTWIAGMVRLRREPGHRQREQQGVAEGAWQSLRSGVTCVGDISRENLAWRILKSLPIRKVCYAELLTLADRPPRNPQELSAALAEVEEDDLLTAGVTPHAPYTVPAEQIRAAIALAAERGRPWCTHWAETREEVDYLAGRPAALPAIFGLLLEQCGVRCPKMTPGDYLASCCRGLRPEAAGGTSAGLLAHANYVNGADIAQIAAAGLSVVFCPRAHRFFGHTEHPYRRLMAAGINVAIGTDSAASNENLALLEELRFVRRTQVEPPPADVLLEMVTLNAARALGLAATIGSLEPGKAADMAAFPLASSANGQAELPPRAGESEPVAALVDHAPTPVGVWVAGQRVV